MAQAIGYVTKTDKGGFEGTLTTMTLKKPISILPNAEKTRDTQPDFRIYTDDRIEIGSGWNRVGKNSGKEYVSLTFAAPEFGATRVFANLGRLAGQNDDGVLAILWSPRD